MVANGVDDPDLHIQVEVADELLHDSDLLCVLPSEPGDLRPDDVQQFQTDRGDPSEVLWPMLRLEALRGAGRIDPGREAGRVHLRRVGREEHVNPVRLRAGVVAARIARVGGEIGALREL